MTKTVQTTRGGDGNFQIYRLDGSSITVELCVPNDEAHLGVGVLHSDTFEQGDGIYEDVVKAMRVCQTDHQA